ncbi:SDR family oxidoreductase [Streptomyces toxytricini]|uniref:SDR family oxidoreductase n=1 Tax=Streptomyces toxytricini TaxID=67369 RepID=UPI003F4D8FD4
MRSHRVPDADRWAFPRRRARSVALVTGVGRRPGLGAAIATRLAETGWDIAFTYWTPYDARMPWGAYPGAPEELSARLAEAGARVFALEADLTDPAAAATVLDGAGAALGRPVTALVLAHAESVASGLLDTSLDSFDRHFAVNDAAAAVRSGEALGIGPDEDRTERARAPWTGSCWQPPGNRPHSA